MFWQILRDLLPAFCVIAGVLLEKYWDLYQNRRKESEELNRIRFTSVLYPIYTCIGGYGRSATEEPLYCSVEYYVWVCGKVDDVLQRYSYAASGEMLDSYINFSMEVYDCVHSARDNEANARTEFEKFRDIVVSEYYEACKILKKEHQISPPASIVKSPH